MCALWVPFLVILSIVSQGDSFSLRSIARQKLQTELRANPVTADGSNFRSEVTEENAYLWFDQAVIHVRGGSGGAGSNAFKFGKGRQHLGARIVCTYNCLVCCTITILIY